MKDGPEKCQGAVDSRAWRGGCLITSMCHGKLEGARTECQGEFGGAGGHGPFGNLRLPIEKVPCDQDPAVVLVDITNLADIRAEDRVHLQT